MNPSAKTLDALYKVCVLYSVRELCNISRRLDDCGDIVSHCVAIIYTLDKLEVPCCSAFKFVPSI